VRTLTPDDVPALVEIATLCEIAETGEADPELVDWIQGGSKLAQFRAFGVDGESGLDAFGYLECVEGHAALEADVRVRPGVDRDVALPVLDAIRREAADFAPALPVHLMVNAGATGHRQWLEAQGAQEIRHFWRMAIDLDDEPPAVPAATDGVVVRRARDDEADLREIFRIVDTAFAEHFGHTDNRSYDLWIENWRVRRGFDLDLWWVVELDGAPVAALLAMTFADEQTGVTTGHVGTLGTLKEARGRGIGTLLLRTSFAEFHRRGYRRVTLGVDSENGTGAVRLYESVGMTAVADWPLYEFPPLSPVQPLMSGPGPAGSTRSDSKPV
jgi:ribosomal protein S18 acetylase RimI-like enzyme